MPGNRSKKHLLIFIFAFSAFAFLFSGCATIDFKGKQDIEALSLAEEIRDSNKEIKTAKGIGWITIQETVDNEPAATEFKMAWATEPPDKIRVTLLSSGLPVETIVSDGKNISFFSHTGKHKLKKYNIKNPSLEDILLIPVRVEDVIMLLSGRVPVKEFTHAFFDDSNENLKTIVLNNLSGKGIQKISADRNNNAASYTTADMSMEPVFEIRFSDHMKVDSASIPSKIILQDKLDRKVTLQISKFYINIPVKKSLFSLTEPR